MRTPPHPDNLTHNTHNTKLHVGVEAREHKVATAILLSGHIKKTLCLCYGMECAPECYSSFGHTDMIYLRRFFFSSSFLVFRRYINFVRIAHGQPSSNPDEVETRDKSTRAPNNHEQVYDYYYIDGVLCGHGCHADATEKL